MGLASRPELPPLDVGVAIRSDQITSRPAGWRAHAHRGDGTLAGYSAFPHEGKGRGRILGGHPQPRHAQLPSLPGGLAVVCSNFFFLKVLTGGGPAMLLGSRLFFFFLFGRKKPTCRPILPMTATPSRQIKESSRIAGYTPGGSCFSMASDKYGTS